MMKILLSTALIALASPSVAQDAKAGSETYDRYCASCHGLEATGHGPMRSVLLVQPADLTRLTVENDGKFPLVRVIKRIDGRDPLVSHGSSMPIYGEFFEGSDMTLKTEAGQPVMTSKPVVELVEYIKSVQVE